MSNAVTLESLAEIEARVSALESRAGVPRPGLYDELAERIVENLEALEKWLEA